MMLAARWRWDDIDVPANALTEDIARFFEEHRFIVDLDGVRQGTAPDQAAQAVPDWLREDAQSWAIVPLVHYNWLVGLIILSRPEGDRRLDWEDFDLLRVVGQQLASYLAERESQEALGEAARFDEFNRRIAFVMHDIKNLASQLSLLARNAEKHADNPDFRADMLVTLRNSSDKLNALLARLGRYGAGGMRKERESVRLDEIAARIAKNMGAQHPVTVTQADETIVSGDAEAIEQALTHLVQNAFDASQAGAPVFLSVHSETPFGTVEIVDSGTGMSADFVHSKLFKPFQSSKEGGFGIGAYEARELVRAMGGRLDVESREGLGTRFVMRIPLEGAKHFYTAHGGAGAADRKEVA
jgi:putative PEP-CTERM system histidine kinase